MGKNLAFLGLGRMGCPMARNLIRSGHRVRGYDPDAGALARSEANGIEAA
ncbi:MAG: NAD(P)-binding domain-containing protein, partial [Nitrospinota bacterium]